MDYMKVYEEWCSNEYFDEATRAELEAIAGDDAEIKDRFYREFNKTIAREYKNVTFGKNDWRVSYGRRYY